jgi:hypothetical protein
VFTKKVHVFKAGPQTSAQGIQREFTKDDIQEVVDSYNPGIHEAPLVIGHSGDNDSTPSFGWISGFSRSGDDLYANVEFTDAAQDLVKKGHYKKVSISFYSPESPINPHKGKWSARHLALLGASPPAVKGLESLSFSEDGLFDFSVATPPEEIFDKELGPTMITEKGPLEMLKERLDEVKAEVNASLKQLEENQGSQNETNVEEGSPSAEENATPDNSNEQFTEMKKKMGREGAESVESAQVADSDMESIPTKSSKKAKPATDPDMEDEEFRENPKSKKPAKGEDTIEEGEEDMEMEDEEFRETPKSKKKPAPAMEEGAGEDEDEDEDDELEEGFGEGNKRKTASGANGQKVQVVQEVYKEGKKKKAPPTDEMEDMESEDDEMEFDEVSHKVSKGGRVSFGTHSSGAGDKVTGRSKTARSTDGGYEDRQKVGKAKEEDREGVTSDSEQDKDRVKTASNSEQDKDRVKTAKSDEGDDSEDSRWAGQPKARKKVMNNDQYDDDDSDYEEKQGVGVSDGTDPHGRDGGPTKVSKLSEEDPDAIEMAVNVKNVKGSKARVIYNSSGEKRAAVKGGAIADHVEGGEPDEEGHVKEVKKAKTSSGSNARGRSGGPTKFPTKSEEEPDNLEMAVDLEDATQSKKVRVVRQKSGDKPSNYAEGCSKGSKKTKDPMTMTGKGSTYREDGMVVEDFGGMGSMAQAKPLGVAEQIYEELKAVREENSRLKREFEEQKMLSRKQKISHFIENLYGEGKLTDAVIPQGELQSYCEGIEFGTLEFSEGETPSSKLLGLLSKLPNMVYFQEVVSNDKFEPEDEDLTPHERAIRMVKNGEASDYLEAIKMAIPWSSAG